MLQDGQQALLDASDQFQSGAEVFWFQQPDTRGQVSALQQSLFWEQNQQRTGSDQIQLQTRSRTMRRCLTEQDLQGVGVQVQSLCLLLHHVHLLSLLVVVAVDAGVGQHLQTESR